MNILKLSATSSTNDFLKDLLKTSDPLNFTVVSTDFQSKGKGQSGDSWSSEVGKNLLFSMLIKFENFKISDQAYLNFAVSNAIYQVLSTYYSLVKIKWPNDIMAANNKICGILIENTVKGTNISHSIVGIGVNVNQLKFSDDLNATSLGILLNRKFNRDQLLVELILAIKVQITTFNRKEFKQLKQQYVNVLYRKNLISKFKVHNDIFSGIILDVTNNGLLQVEVNNGELKYFANKEISLLLY